MTTASIVPTADTPAAVDGLLDVLVRYASMLAPQGPVRITVGTVSVELGTLAAAGTVPAVTDTPPALAVVRPVTATAPASAGHGAPGPGGSPDGDGEAVAEHVVRASTVGVFYRSPEPGAAPFVAEGDIVGAGQQIGIVEAMKLMIPLESDRGGRVLRVLVDDGESVEHGQPVLALAAS